MGTFDYFNRKPYLVEEPGDVSYTYIEKPIKITFIKEKKYKAKVEKL